MSSWLGLVREVGQVMLGIKDMVYVDRRTFFDIVIIGFVLGAIGVLPDLDHWFAVTMGWAKLRFAHSPLVFLAYAFIWGLAIIAFTARQPLVGSLLKQPGKIGVRGPSYALSEHGLMPAKLATVQDLGWATLGLSFYDAYWLPQQTAHQPPTTSYFTRSRE